VKTLVQKVDERRSRRQEIAYAALFEAAGRESTGWRDERFGELLADAWSAAYARGTPWSPEILEVDVADLTYLFDAAPALSGAAGEDRVVGVFGRSARVSGRRDAARMAGFVPDPTRWSGRELDRGHFVAHAAGGGTDLNLFPQPAQLNRGRSEAGRRWRAMEREIAARDGRFLFVRPQYDDATWIPVELDAGFVTCEDDLVVERFPNR
jgi:hypothetical protein